MDNERWLSDGDCRKCRREDYCNKPCTAQKRHREAILRGMVARAMSMAVCGSERK